MEVFLCWLFPSLDWQHDWGYTRTLLVSWTWTNLGAVASVAVVGQMMDGESDAEDAKAAAETSAASSCSESQLTAGNDDYSATYETMQTIGKGAFGYVRLARRRADQQLVSNSNNISD